MLSQLSSRVLVNQLMRSSGNRKNRRLGSTFGKSRNRRWFPFVGLCCRAKRAPFSTMVGSIVLCLLPGQVLAGFLCCDQGFFAAGLRSRIIYFETHRKVGTFSYALAFTFHSSALPPSQTPSNSKPNPHATH